MDECVCSSGTGHKRNLNLGDQVMFWTKETSHTPPTFEDAGVYEVIEVDLNDCALTYCLKDRETNDICWTRDENFDAPLVVPKFASTEDADAWMETIK